MITVLLHLVRLLPFLCGGHRQLALENLALRHQLAVYKRTLTRPKLHATDRLFWAWLARVWASWKQPLVIVTPDTVLRWQRRAQRRRPAAYPHRQRGSESGSCRPILDALERVGRFLAKDRQTPCIRHRYRHDRLSVCSGLAVSPKRRRVALYLRCRPRALSGLDIQAFLRQLLRHLRGPVDLLWDRGPIPRRREVRAFLDDHPRLHVHYFPAYAPELNPAEYVWGQADRALANGAPDDLRELRDRLDGATRRLRRSQNLLWSCIYASELPWTR